jgi:hypothetical protein
MEYVRMTSEPQHDLTHELLVPEIRDGCLGSWLDSGSRMANEPITMFIFLLMICIITYTKYIRLMALASGSPA